MIWVAVLCLAGCASEPLRPQKIDEGILAEMNKATQRQQPVQPEAVNTALLPPMRVELPNVPRQQVEPKFDLVVNGAPARDVFMSIVSGTRYSMVIHPDVNGVLSVTLKDVTVREALESIREVYGYEFKVDGARVYIQPAGLQTRVFQVNYLIGLRAGRSDVRVSSGSISGNVPGQTANTSPGTITGAPVGVTTGGGPGGAVTTAPATLSAIGASALSGNSSDASRVSTVSQTDFWTEVQQALRTLVGLGEGRSVVVSPQSGVVVVRAMPQEIRSVESYLKAMRISIERQVMIEAKVIDVTLNDAYQSGVNWAAFPSPRVAAGQVGSNVTIGATGPLIGRSITADVANSGITTQSLATGLAGTAVAASGAIGAGVFGLAFQTQNFAALLSFLESQGNVQVLSSPRVATLNNQKAVLKVGVDQFFVTNVTGTPITTTTGATTNVQLTPTFNSFFSGISLDITPQIDIDGNILLHVHPLVSTVGDGTLKFDFGNGDRNVPLAKSSISETDSIVRVQDGNIVALGGLMRVETASDRSGLPGLQDVPGIGGAFRNTTRTTTKRELVILIKPTVIKSDSDWEQDIQQSRDRLQGYGSK